MKITEPKTPYAKHYDPAEDPSDEDEDDGDDDGNGSLSRDSNMREADTLPERARRTPRAGAEEDIPGLSLGEPEEAVPELPSLTPRSSTEKTVHVDDSLVPSDGDEMAGLSAEEREKHRKFEEMRKKHYEMKNVARLLGNPDAIPDDEEDNEEEDRQVPTVPSIPNGSI